MSTSAAAQVLRERANFYIDSAAHCRSSLMFDQFIRLAADCADLARQIEQDATEELSELPPATDSSPED